jgi:DNA repair protein RadA/Sms
MGKLKTVFACQSCGRQAAKWLGRCPECGSWNSLVEESSGGAAEERPAWGTRTAGKPVRLTEVPAESIERLTTGIGELDRILGGGVVPGSLVLLGGDPGIGKSTLLLVALDRLAAGGPVLYVTGEESVRQTKLRAERLGADSDDLHLLSESDAERVLAAATAMKPRALAIDSIQSMYLPELGSAPGSIGQVREVAGRLMSFAKSTDTPTFIVGHVTKDGAIAGPRVLEHIVDTVLYFEGDRGHSFRVLRAHKNRFGSTNEIGVFEMRNQGLCEVSDPSSLFLAERPVGAPGSVVTAAQSGTRPLLVEIQALVAPAAYGTARRTAVGVDGARVAMLAAVLEKKEGVDLTTCDLFVNVAGGIELDEPSSDLPVIAALVSSLREKAIEPETIVLGEVGLAGEVRAVSQIEPRLIEAAKMGFKRAVIPGANARRLERAPIAIVPVDTVTDALAELLSSSRSIRLASTLPSTPS